MYEIWRSRSSLNPFQRSGRVDGTQSPVYEACTPLGRIHSATVNFKDISIGPEALETANGDIDDDDRHSEDSTNKSAILLKAPKVPHRTKYVIILVGLPGRGKTFLCNKIKCYLNWLGHHTRHFNVGSYRRLQKGDHEVQTADFFDAHNPAGLEARNRALYAALDDLQAYLYSDMGQVAIFDATNTTQERRRLLIHRFHGRFQYLFIESICTDDKVLEQNYRFKMQYSPDYKGMEMEQSLNDFKARIHKYEEVYEPIDDRNIHYIKLIDMVTGRGYMDVNRISGYLPGKIVFFLMQVCKAGMAQARRIWLTRHGESEYNLKHRIGGNSPLAHSGEVYARCLPEMLIERLPMHEDDETCVPVSVWTSTLCRTIQTARYLPFPKLRWKALDEIQAGACDGLTYEEIAKHFPEEFAARAKDKLRYRYPAGESYLDVIQRLEPVIIEMEREKECIVVVAHQAVLRALLGYFMAKPLESIPTLDVPLHTLLELRPRPDGTMDFEYVPMAPDAAAAMEAAMASGPLPGAFSSGSFSGAPSPMLLSPMYSMGRHDSPVVMAVTAVVGAAAAAAAAAPPQGGSAVAAVAASGSALAAAGSTAWSPGAGDLSGGSAYVAVAGSAAPLVEATSTSPGSEPLTAAAAPGTTSSAATTPGPPRHSRTPSLNCGIAGCAAASPSGSSPTAGFHFAVAGSVGGVSPTGGSVDSPSSSSRTVALVAAAVAVADSSRNRKVRVPFGATMGGGGSEGGAAPPDVPYGSAPLLAAAASSAAASPSSLLPHSLSPSGTLQHSPGRGSPSSSAADSGPHRHRQVQQATAGQEGGSHAGEEDMGGLEGEGMGSGAITGREPSELEGAVMSLAYLIDRTSLLDRVDSQGLVGAGTGSGGASERGSGGGASPVT